MSFQSDGILLPISSRMRLCQTLTRSLVKSTVVEGITFGSLLASATQTYCIRIVGQKGEYKKLKRNGQEHDQKGKEEFYKFRIVSL